QIFEDLYPHPDELTACLAEAKRLDFEALARRDTRHNVRGLTEASCEVLFEWWPADGSRPKRTRYTEGPRLFAEARKVGIFLGYRLVSEFDASLATRPLCPAGRVRSVDSSPWRGMPSAMLDQHCVEGRQRDTHITLLCGAESQHLVLAQRVQADGGWE